MRDLTHYDEQVRRSLFFLGHRPGRVDRPIIYPREPKKRPHLAYYGTTRSGKTFAIEYALQQLARDRSAGFCYVDPHGSSFWRMASYLRQMEITDRVLFWDLNDPEYVVTYDPFHFPDKSRSYIAGNLTSALLATLGVRVEASDLPHLKTATEEGLLSLLELELPFLLSRELFDPQDTEVKRAIARRLDRPTLLSTIAEMPRILDRYRELAPPHRRIENLFRDDRLRLTFTAVGVDFRKLMDEGWIVLVNTEPKDQSDEAALLFTRLLVKTLFMAAKQRRKEDATAPFFLAIDEASRYLTADTARILAETAGYGLYLLVGMQSIEQARLESEESYVALSRNVNGEIVMRLVDFEEKLFFTRRFFGDRLNFRRKKHEERRRVVQPFMVQDDTLTRTRSVDSAGREIEGEITGSVFHAEYEEGEERTPFFYTSDELERLEARRFDQVQRFGVARVNENPPTEIEIPELDPPMYDEDEMRTWLRSFKAIQPATLPLPEAQKRFDELRTAHLERLRESAPPPVRRRRRRESTPPISFD